MKHVVGPVLFALVASACSAKPSSLGSGSSTIPPRPAGAAYPGWEYFCASIDAGVGYADVVATFLNDAGKEGWELAVVEQIAGQQFCFKRPRTEGVTGGAAAAPAAVAGAVAAPAEALASPAEVEKLNALAATWARGITKFDETSYGITKDTFDGMYMNGAVMMRAARMVPWTKDGKMEGFKLYAIRPGSVVALLGFSNGDTVHEINGFPLSSVEETLKVLAKVRAASSLELTMTRRGQPLSLRYSIQ